MVTQFVIFLNHYLNIREFQDSGCTLNEAVTAKKELLKQDPSLQELLDDAYAYALFPSVGKTGFGIGGAFGRGEVWKGAEFLGEARLR